MKGAGLSMLDFKKKKKLFHVLQINLKIMTCYRLVSEIKIIYIVHDYTQTRPYEKHTRAGRFSRFYWSASPPQACFPPDSSVVVVSGDFHVCVVGEGLPVALLKRGAQLLPRANLVGVREALPLRPLVDLVQRLLPLHGRRQLLRQLPPHVALAHVALSVHVGVDVDLGTTDLHRRQIIFD